MDFQDCHIEKDTCIRVAGALTLCPTCEKHVVCRAERQHFNILGAQILL